MSFQQGLSGLNGAAKSLAVIGNNIANSATVGFKQSQAQFADIYANSLNGVGGQQAGIGVSVSQVAQQFTQGNIETTANPLDIAINGGGFFRTSVNGALQYSRNGQFQLDKNGFMVNAQLAKLTGYIADQTGKILPGAPVPIQIDPSDMAPQATTKVNTQINLDSRSQMPTTVPFSVDDPTSYNKQIPIDVYDSLGNAHVMSSFYVKTGTDANGENTWDIYLSSDGMEVTAATVASKALQGDPTASPAVPAPAAVVAARTAYNDAVKAIPAVPANIVAASLAYAHVAGAAIEAAAVAAGANATQAAAINASYLGVAADSVNSSRTPDQIDGVIAGTVRMPAKPAGTLVFNTLGTLDKSAMASLPTPQSLPLQIKLPVFPSTGATPVLNVAYELTGSTQISAATSEKKTTQDGFAGGQLTRFAAGADGILLGQYSNGHTKALAQIVLANFSNPNGLEPLGNNAWAETSASGGPLVGEPNTGKLGNLRSEAVEVSNVDLTAELVNMITAQRAYQANAQTIKTEDSVLQTLVNLR